MGWFVGISTRTPTTSIFLTAAPSSYAPDALPHAWALRWALPCQRTPVLPESAVAAGLGGLAAEGGNWPAHAPDLAAAGPANPGSSYPAPPSLTSAGAAPPDSPAQAARAAPVSPSVCSPASARALPISDACS